MFDPEEHARSIARSNVWRDVRSRDWLQHQWEFSIVQRASGRASIYEVMADGQRVFGWTSLSSVQQWIRDFRPRCLAELIAAERTLHPADATIWSGWERLGRIKPDLWGSYDAVRISGTASDMVILSAKARAAFPDHEGVVIKVWRHRLGGTIHDHRTFSLMRAKEGTMKDLQEMTDADLIALYEATDPADPFIDRIANEMERRGIDY